MIEKWLIQFQNEENQFIITEMAKKYSLSKEEYIHLVNLLIYYYSISTTPNTLKAVQVICIKLKEFGNDLKKHQTHNLFKECLSVFLKGEQEQTGNFNKINNFLEEGFLFHSFNPAFLPQINEKGLIVKEKPWDLEEVEEIRKIFWNKLHKNVFGLYQGRKLTPVFFANNLLSSSYYGLSSPTFFRKFIENNPKYFDVFFRRDYPKAKESIENLCSVLDSEEKKKVFSFFEKYWDFFTTPDLAYVAVSTKQKLGIAKNPPPRNPNESEIDYLLRRILLVNNEMMSVDIARDQLEIFSYQSFAMVPYSNEKTIV